MVYENVKRYCDEHGLSIARFEKLCGIGNGIVATWGEGASPTMRSLEKIAAYTGIPLANWTMKQEEK